MVQPSPHPAPAPLLSAADVRRIAAELDLRPTKQWGQNFVIDPNTIRRIVQAADVTADEHVLEIGPGLGSLTLGLLDAAAAVTAVEIDPVTAARLPRTAAEFRPGAEDALAVLHADAMTLSEQALAEVRPAAAAGGLLLRQVRDREVGGALEHGLDDRGDRPRGVLEVGVDEQHGAAGVAELLGVLHPGGHRGGLAHGVRVPADVGARVGGQRGGVVGVAVAVGHPADVAGGAGRRIPRAVRGPGRDGGLPAQPARTSKW